MLIPTKFMPDLAKVKREGIKGAVYQLAILPIDAAKIDEWLELFPKYGYPLEEKYGLRTVGYWKRGGGEPYQVELSYCMKLSCVKNWAAIEDYGRAITADPEVKEWWKKSLQYRQHHKASHLVPAYLPY